MTMAPWLGVSHYRAVARSVAKLQKIATELQRQTQTSVDALHTIRARTSNVLVATAAFSALATEIAAFARRLSTPLPPDAYDYAAERVAFHQELHLLIDQLETYQRRYAAELSLTKLNKPQPKKHWWHAFKLWGQPDADRVRRQTGRS